MLARSIPWTQQPQVSAQAARGGQFSSGLAFLALPEQNGFVDVISGGRDNGGGASYPHYVNSGTMIRNPPTVNNGFQTNTALNSINGPFTLFTEFRLNSQSRQTAFISADSSTGAGFGIGLDWSSFVSKGIQYWNGGSTNAVSAAGAFVDEFRMVRIAITHDGSTLKFFSGGVLHSSVANTTLPAANTNRKTYIMGSYFGANTSGSASIAAAWDRPLSEAEIRAVSANPWQLFAPMRRFIPIGATGTVYRPGTDVAVSGWTFTNAASFSGAVGELTYDPSSYATSPDLTSPATAALDIAMPAGSYTVSVAGQRNASQGQVRLVYLDAGGSSVGATSWQALSGSEATYNLPVTTTGTATQVRLELQP